jgi:hypothetical protein
MTRLERTRRRSTPLASPGPGAPDARAVRAARLDRDVIVVPVGARDEQRAAAASRPPVWRRWWFWTAVGVAVVGGVVAAVALTGDGEPGVPPTALGDMRFY